MTDRQDPFADLTPWGQGSTTGEGEPAAILPPPPSQAMRNRRWEKQQRSDGYCQVSYRKVPTDLRDAIREIAQEHYLRVDDIGRLFLEYALAAYQAGEIELNPVIERGRLTLFPEK